MSENLEAQPTESQQIIQQKEKDYTIAAAHLGHLIYQSYFIFKNIIQLDHEVGELKKRLPTLGQKEP